MNPRHLQRKLTTGTLFLGLVFGVSSVSAQDQGVVDTSGLTVDGDAGRPALVLPVIRIERQDMQRDVQGLYGDQTVDVNLGLEITPVDGLSLSAEAWSLEEKQSPLSAVGQSSLWQPQLGSVFQENRADAPFALDQSLLSGGVESSGIDIGASYQWQTDSAGTFTVSTSATYIHEFNQPGSLPDVSLLRDDHQLPGSPDLQGSLTLQWQFGKHSATAVTNYFDSFKDISELNIEDINRLVEDITTVDLQYGYNVLTDKQDRAVVSFSFGIRNIFDRKTTQILNQNSRVVDQNGRVAYGSIKYQF